MVQRTTAAVFPFCTAMEMRCKRYCGLRVSPVALQSYYRYIDRPFPFAARAFKWDGLASQTRIGNSQYSI